MRIEIKLLESVLRLEYLEITVKL